MQNTLELEKEDPSKWEKIDECLHIAQEILAQNNYTSIDKKNILKKRAALLAKEHIEKKSTTTLIVEFIIENQKFALNIKQIKKVEKLSLLTPLPCTPSFIAGIINFHGYIVTIINLAELMGLRNKVSKDTQVIIIEDNSSMMGILSHHIIGVRSIDIQEIQTITTSLYKNFNFITGITSEHTILLDANHLISNEKFVIDETV